MSSYLNKQWTWDVTTMYDSDTESDVIIYIWEQDNNTATKYTSDDNGNINTVVTEALYTIDNTDDITTTTYTPYTLSICKYTYFPIGLNTNFINNRIDTFYLTINNYISETDSSVVAGYTGITIDHDNKIVTISEDHTIEEVYDYTQYDLTQNPIKDYPTGIFQTTDGNNFTLIYDLTIDNCSFTGSGKYINMSDNTLTLSNDGTTDIKIKDINGVSVTFKFTNLIDQSEVRLYKSDDMSEIDGVENVDGDTYIYNYNYTEDIDIIAVIYNENYKPIRLELTLTEQDTYIPIQQEYDRNFQG